ncbi:MAG: hypothetical protein V1647_02435 [Pseudomonadota bacterium]
MSEQHDQVLKEINDVLRAYNYLAPEDEPMAFDELPSLVSHLLLLRVFTQESLRFGILYEDVEDFCDFAVDYIYQKESEGIDLSSVDVEDIVDAFRSRGLKH